MGKAEFLTPKAIGNRIKQKGLQKLRWYCQMCQKQCRDENGFKCHLTSESHKRQMEIFGQDPEGIIDDFSQEFEARFLEILRVSHPGSRVHANKVYQEIVSDKVHIHMNSTKWYTLSEFVKYLGKEGKCKVEETDKGWFVTLNMEDPFKALDRENRLKRSQREAEAAQRSDKMIQAQIERAKKRARTDDAHKDDEPQILTRDETSAPLTFNMGKSSKNSNTDGQAGTSHARGSQQRPPLPPGPTSKGNGVFGNVRDEEEEGGNGDEAAGKGGRGGGKLRLQQIAEREMARQQQRQSRGGQDNLEVGLDDGGGMGRGAGQGGEDGAGGGTWLRPGIVVKIVGRGCEGKGEKGGVVKVRSGGEAVVELNKGGRVCVGEKEVETVIPNFGKEVMVVSGRYAGEVGVVKDVDVNEFKVKVVLEQLKKKVWFEYEQVSKVFS